MTSMTEFSHRIVTVAVLFISLIATNNAFAEPASITAISGFVTATNADGEVRRLKTGDALEHGDVITTGDGASASISYSDGSTTNLNALESHTVNYGNADGGAFAQRTLGAGATNLSTATSAGGTTSTSVPTNPGSGGTPVE
jgi:hypothetical protein